MRICTWNDVMSCHVISCDVMWCWVLDKEDAITCVCTFPTSLFSGVAFIPMTIGDHCIIEHDCIIEAASIGSCVHIGSNCIIGKRCIISSCCRVEDGTVLAPGTVMPPFAVFAGNPGKWLFDHVDEWCITYVVRCAMQFMYVCMCECPSRWCWSSGVMIRKLPESYQADCIDRTKTYYKHFQPDTSAPTSTSTTTTARPSWWMLLSLVFHC